MKLQIFAVRDQKSDQFGTPMFMISKGQCIRSFSDEINNNKESTNLLNKHPSDFALYELGEYDTQTGIMQTKTPQQVVLATELVIKDLKPE